MDQPTQDLAAALSATIMQLWQSSAHEPENLTASAGSRSASWSCIHAGSTASCGRIARLLGEPPALVVLLPELVQRERLAGTGLLRGELRLQGGALRLECRQPRARVRLLGLLLGRQLRRLRGRYTCRVMHKDADVLYRITKWRRPQTSRMTYECSREPVCPLQHVQSQCQPTVCP